MTLITKAECEWARKANAAVWLPTMKIFIEKGHDPSYYIRLVVRNRFLNGVYGGRAMAPKVIRQLSINLARSFGVEYND